MIDRLRNLAPGTRVDADICIIGGGAAGISIAHLLANTGKKIVVLSGGAKRERASDRDLYRGVVVPGTNHEPLEEARRRVWGGSTVVWGGRCIPFEPIDFEARSWVPGSGWPFSYDELLPYYRRANDLCEAGEYAYEAGDVFGAGAAEMLRGFDTGDMTSSSLERWSPPTNFARRYGPALGARPNIVVALDAHALGIRVSGDGGQVDRIAATTSANSRFNVVAKDYVLACGGLENPRLLLASNDVAPAGVGNRFDNVGRYYMSHIAGVLGSVRLSDPGSLLAYGFETDDEGVYCRRRFRLTASAQERLEIGNGVAFFFRPNIASAVHRNALFSAAYLGKTYMAALRGRSPAESLRALRDSKAARREHWRVVVKDAPGIVPESVRLFRQRILAKRRLPMFLGDPAEQLPLFYQTEHIPNRESQVRLCGERDRFGMPRLEVGVRFTTLDFKTVLEFHRVLAARLQERSLGEFVYDMSDPLEHLERQTSLFNSNAHHIGTTRISERAEDGVVDRDCKVHGVANLFVAGSSVFPTSGHANPTLTLVALAARLADFLRYR